ncbi:DUF2812 domain-containing protein [Paenibacillus tritici]|uniref:DUF2812 domain-containing protein n=1 Tax=Paenibacillus tritici TaxID=1873425 RepID=A0ABX2DW40_9BACL|nr:DUF2812 domain-containing protein [Paenibacillus tritici]NQX48031.1 DUF2812 domain-containing protein [Paenibacillus tritici]
MKRVFRPFWSYDLPKSEAWLADMASQGWVLAEWSLLLRRFTFRQAQPVQRSYQIGYGPSSQPSMSSYLAAEGWSKRLQQGKWTVYENERQLAQIKAYPSRKEVLRRNRKISYIFMGILVYLLLIAMIPLIALGFSLTQDTPMQTQQSPLWAVTWVAAVLAVILLILAIYSIIKLRAASKGFQLNQDVIKKTHEQQKPAGLKMTRLKLGWMYAPDRLEEWLEEKERLGWNLYKVGPGGTLFHFSQGSPRQMKYHADYQVIGDEEYVELHRQAGWNKVYSSPFSLQKWTIWSREQPDHAQQPEIYSDPYHRLKHARKIAVSYTLLFLPMILLYSLNVTAFIDGMLQDGITASRAWNTSLMFLCILIFGSFAVRTWLYYRRLKKL